MTCARSPMAHHPRRGGDVLVAIVEDLHVRAAGRAVLDPQQHLVGVDLWDRSLLEPYVSGRVEAQYLHQSSEGASSVRTSSTDEVVRRRSAESESMSTSARLARMLTCSSVAEAIGMSTYAVLPPQSMPPGNWTNPNAARMMYSRDSLVPWGIATPSPRKVEICCSRASMPSM